MKNNKFKIFILVCGFIGLLIEILVNDIAVPLIENIPARNAVQIVCIFIASGASILLVSVIWETFQKKQFSNELLEVIGMTKNVIDSGISDYLKSSNINWETALNSVTNFELFLTFGESWIDETESKYQSVKNYISKGKNKMTVIFPDYTKDEIVNALLVKYPKNHDRDNTADTIKERIISTIKGFWEINKNINIKLYNGINSSSYYFLNEKCYFSPYSHEYLKGVSVPIIEIQNKGESSSFYKFCRTDMTSILNKSKPAQDIDDDLKKYYNDYVAQNKSIR